MDGKFNPMLSQIDPHIINNRATPSVNATFEKSIVLFFLSKYVYSRTIDYTMTFFENRIFKGHIFNSGHPHQVDPCHNVKTS